jgi:hypothetical protein
MRFVPAAAFVLFACWTAAAGASTPSDDKSLGDVKVSATRPSVGTGAQGWHATNFTFVVSERRILATSPGNPNWFDLTLEDNGCLRGTVVLGRYGTPHPATPPDDNVDLRQICPTAPAKGDPAGLSRWKDEVSKLQFAAQISADGKRIIAESGDQRGEFVLGEGAAADELRRRPELLAAAFAYGYVPAADGTSDGAMSNYNFVLASGN